MVQGCGSSCLPARRSSQSQQMCQGKSLMRPSRATGDLLHNSKTECNLLQCNFAFAMWTSDILIRHPQPRLCFWRKAWHRAHLVLTQARGEGVCLAMLMRALKSYKACKGSGMVASEPYRVAWVHGWTPKSCRVCKLIDGCQDVF